MKHLNEYLLSEGVSQTNFAKRVGISDGYLSQILAGLRRPSFDLMVRIESATGKRVALDAWRASQNIAQTSPSAA